MPSSTYTVSYVCVEPTTPSVVEYPDDKYCTFRKVRFAEITVLPMSRNRQLPLLSVVSRSPLNGEKVKLPGVDSLYVFTLASGAPCNAPGNTR